MATGIQSINSKRTFTVRLLEGVTVANAAPTGVPVAVPLATQGFALSELGGFVPDACSVWIYSTAGSGVMTVAPPRAWGYDAASGLWFPLGEGSGDVTAGLLNGGVGLVETSANQIVHASARSLPDHLDGIGVQLGTIAGTATAINVDVKFTRRI